MNQQNPLQCAEPLVLLTRPQAAKMLGVRPQTLAVWATSKRYNLPYIKVGSKVLYLLSDLQNFLIANRKGKAQ